MANPVLENIRKQLDNPLPTADVGMTVNWFEANEDDRCYAAIVTKIEAPGKLVLEIHKPNAHAMNKSGVLHRSHPVHRNKHATETMRCGTWDFLPGQTANKRHYQLHLTELKRKEAAMVEQEKINAEIAATGKSERAVH